MDVLEAEPVMGGRVTEEPFMRPPGDIKSDELTDRQRAAMMHAARTFARNEAQYVNQKPGQKVIFEADTTFQVTQCPTYAIVAGSTDPVPLSKSPTLAVSATALASLKEMMLFTVDPDNSVHACVPTTSLTANVSDANGVTPELKAKVTQSLAALAASRAVARAIREGKKDGSGAAGRGKALMSVYNVVSMMNSDATQAAIDKALNDETKSTVALTQELMTMGKQSTKSELKWLAVEDQAKGLAKTIIQCSKASIKDGDCKDSTDKKLDTCSMIQYGKQTFCFPKPSPTVVGKTGKTTLDTIQQKFEERGFSDRGLNAAEARLRNFWFGQNGRIKQRQREAQSSSREDFVDTGSQLLRQAGVSPDAVFDPLDTMDLDSVAGGGAGAGAGAGGSAESVLGSLLGGGSDDDAFSYGAFVEGGDDLDEYGAEDEYPSDVVVW